MLTTSELRCRQSLDTHMGSSSPRPWKMIRKDSLNRPESKLTTPPGHLWHDQWTILSGPLSDQGCAGMLPSTTQVPRTESLELIFVDLIVIWLYVDCSKSVETRLILPSDVVRFCAWWKRPVLLHCTTTQCLHPHRGCHSAGGLKRGHMHST